MYCVGCGTALQPGQNFCAGCGKASGSAEPTPVQSRLDTHIRLLAVAWFIVSAYRMIPGIALVALFGTIATLLPVDVPNFVLGMLQLVGFAFIAVAGLGLVVGWGLLERRSWARTAAIVLGFISLLEVPFGTALGIYTLWVLMPAGAETEFRRG